MRNLSRYLKLFSTALFISFVGHTSANAQAPNGIIKGAVHTLDGKPISYVTISLVGLRHLASSNQQGDFTFKNIPAGKYLIKANCAGFLEQTQETQVPAGQTITIDIRMKEDVRTLDDVVITAFRKTNNEIETRAGKADIKAMDMPQSITVIGKETLAQQQTQRMSDVLKNVNGVYIMGTTGGTQEEIAGRGFAFGANNTFKNGSRINNGVMPELSSLESVPSYSEMLPPGEF
jgi:iron complex outermembrane receptor protein